MKNDILHTLKNKPLKFCVLATSSIDKEPWANTMTYAIQDDLTIILRTRPTTKKWSNLKQNNKVSLVFGGDFNSLNIQYMGTAQLLEEGQELVYYSKLFFNQNPYALKFKTPDSVYIKITPIWVRATDFTKDPPETIEENI